MSSSDETNRKAIEEARQKEAARLAATKAREISITTVFIAMGCAKDPKDEFQWRTVNNDRISTGDRDKKPQAWYDHDQEKGGYGAIDLVMHLGGMRYSEALTWLGSETTKTAVISTAIIVAKRQAEKSTAKNTEPPKEVKDNWNTARNYLINVRKLSPELINRMHQEGTIYADSYNNVVFMSYDKKSAELRGTGSFPYHGLRGAEKSPFRILSIDNQAGAAFTESAIEALSLRDLGFKGYIVGFAGQAKEKAGELAVYLHSKGWKIVSAYNSDKTGEQMSKNLAQALEGKQVPERLAPVTKDWNEDLKAGHLLGAVREKEQVIKSEVKQAPTKNNGQALSS